MRSTRRYVLTAVLAVALVIGAYLFVTSPSGTEVPRREQVETTATQARVDLGATDSDDPESPLESDPASQTPLMQVSAVQWRKRPEEDVEWESYLSMPYSDLRTLAESGDRRAAAYLSHFLLDCRNFPGPQSDSEIDAAVTEMRHTHIVPTYTDGGVRMQDFNNSLDSLEANIEIYERRAKTCRNVPVEHRVDWEDWASRAFSSGYTDDLIHMQFSFSMDSEDYKQLLDDLWASGEPTALVSLALAKTREYVEGSAPHAQIEALAYYLAAQRLLQDYVHDFDVSPDTDQMSSVISSEIAYLRSVLRPSEVAEAEEMSDRQFDENSKCCLVWPNHYFTSN